MSHMKKPLKVYGWQGYSRSSAKKGFICSREIVAARSQAEAARCAGFKAPRQMFCFGETGNADEIATATAKPGVVFWRNLDGHSDPWQTA